MHENPQPPISVACQASGAQSGDARYSNATNVKSQRLTSTSRPQIRTVTAAPSVTGGVVSKLNRPKQAITLAKAKKNADRYAHKYRPMPNNKAHKTPRRERPLAMAIY